MSTARTFKDQAKRNAIGVQVGYQLLALVGMLSREIDHDGNDFKDLVTAILPRFETLTTVVMDLCSEESALENGDLVAKVYGNNAGARSAT